MCLKVQVDYRGEVSDCLIRSSIRLNLFDEHGPSSMTIRNGHQLMPDLVAVAGFPICCLEFHYDNLHVKCQLHNGCPVKCDGCVSSIRQVLDKDIRQPRKHKTAM